MTANDQHIPDAMYVVSVHGDGAGAYLVQGWAAMCASVIAEHYHEPDEDQRQGILRLLNDEAACPSTGSSGWTMAASRSGASPTTALPACASDT